MRAALHSEWTKLRTVTGTWWLLLGMVVTTVALSAAAAAVVPCPAASGSGSAVLTGVQLGQALAAVLGVVAVSGEFSSGLIRTTLTAVPRRGTLLAAKGITLASLVAAAATVAVLGSGPAGRLTRRCRFGSALRPVLPEATESILYLTLIALLSLGVATVVRDAAASTGLVLGVLYLPPIVSSVVHEPHWRHLIQKISPAGSSPGMTILWAAAALAAGALLLSIRDG